jgi:glycerol-3-phosphate O-acyltransferase
MLRFFTADGDFTIAFGKCMDIFGNPVDAEGRSYDSNGNEIDIRDYFKLKGELKYDTQRDSVYTKMLSESIVDAFHTNTVVMPENLIAFIAFKLFQKKNPEDDIYSILRIPEDFRTLNFDELTNAVAGLQKELIKMAAKQKIRISPLIEGDPAEIVRYGIKKMGVYHAKRPFLLLKNGEVKCQDMKVLLFYHNRLEGFGLEKYV